MSGRSSTPQAAAFFDLDRTLLAGASGPVLSDAMRAAGVISASIPGEQLMYSLFNAIGETLPAMAVARQGAALAKGRSRRAVQQAAEDVADRLIDLVQPYAYAAFAEHRAAGRPIVLATTTPYDLVAPFARKLGLDDVVATRYGEAADGTYDGSIDGHFVWSTGKLAAVREWSSAHGVDVGESWAYSDSIFDVPLLSAVAHPVAVNPDPRMTVMATARRWPIMHLDVPAGVAKVPVINMELQKLLLALTRPEFIPFARFDISGYENIPARGGALIVGNHRSYFDVAAMAMLVARSGRPVRFLGKREVFKAPVIGHIATAMGGIPVDRGTGSDEPLRAAAEALAAGELVAMMPEGTIPRGRAFFDPVLKGRWGAARLAAMTKVPVIPVGLWGTERVWPRSSRVPNVLNVFNPPQVTITAGAPVAMKYRSADADTRRMMAAIVDLLPAAAREAREPTAEELAASLPPGYHGDPDNEGTRRPGTDA